MDHWRREQLLLMINERGFYRQLEHAVALVQQLGFDYYAFSFVAPTCSIKQDNYPGQWTDHYRRREYCAIDPVLAHCERSSFPLLWTPEAFADAPQLWTDAQDHGLCRGWTQPFHGPNGQRSSLSVVRRELPISPKELYKKGAAVLWLVEALHRSAAALFNDRDDHCAPEHAARGPMAGTRSSAAGDR